MICAGWGGLAGQADHVLIWPPERARDLRTVLTLDARPAGTLEEVSGAYVCALVGEQYAEAVSFVAEAVKRNAYLVVKGDIDADNCQSDLADNEITVAPGDDESVWAAFDAMTRNGRLIGLDVSDILSVLGGKRLRVVRLSSHRPLAGKTFFREFRRHVRTDQEADVLISFAYPDHKRIIKIVCDAVGELKMLAGYRLANTLLGIHMATGGESGEPSFKATMLITPGRSVNIEPCPIAGWLNPPPAT